MINDKTHSFEFFGAEDISITIKLLRINIPDQRINYLSIVNDTVISLNGNRRWLTAPMPKGLFIIKSTAIHCQKNTELSHG